jgi:transcriptional regulator with XRE-family HTH domain
MRRPVPANIKLNTRYYRYKHLKMSSVNTRQHRSILILGYAMDTRELRETLAENIKKQRRILGLTQEKLAEMADISSNMINDIEGRRTWVSDKTILKLAGALHVEVYQLFVPPVGSDTERAGISKEALQQLKKMIDAEFDAILKK